VERIRKYGGGQIFFATCTLAAAAAHTHTHTTLFVHFVFPHPHPSSSSTPLLFACVITKKAKDIRTVGARFFHFHTRTHTHTQLKTKIVFSSSAGSFRPRVEMKTFLSAPFPSSSHAFSLFLSPALSRTANY